MIGATSLIGAFGALNTPVAFNNTRSTSSTPKPLYDRPDHEWLFNDGSGTTITDEAGSLNLELHASHQMVWDGTGDTAGLNRTIRAVNNTWAAGSNPYWDNDSGTIYHWFETGEDTGVNNIYQMWAIGNGVSDSTANYNREFSKGHFGVVECNVTNKGYWNETFGTSYWGQAHSGMYGFYNMPGTSGTDVNQGHEYRPKLTLSRYTGGIKDEPLMDNENTDKIYLTVFAWNWNKTTGWVEYRIGFIEEDDVDGWNTSNFRRVTGMSMNVPDNTSSSMVLRSDHRGDKSVILRDLKMLYYDSYKPASHDQLVFTQGYGKDSSF